MGNENKHLHVAIVGGGIAGLALALGLNRANISYTLYEASPKFTTVGAGISLGPNALRAMDLLDPRLTEPYSQISSGHRVLGKEHVFFEFMLAERGFGASRGFHGATVESEHFIKSTAHRHDLMRIMKNLLPPDTLKLGKRVASVTQDDDGAKITFDDGEIAVADVVVGCDGGKGLTRKAVLGDKFPDEVEVAYANRYVYRTVIPSGKAQEILGEYAGSGRIFMGPGHYVMFYELSDGRYNLVAGVQDEQPWTQPKWTYEVSKEEMYEDFKGCDPRLDKLLDYATPLRWGLFHHLRTSTYVNGRIALLGDVAHASTPHQGAGAGQGFEDALILSHLLSLVDGDSSLDTALNVYDSMCRPRGQEIVQTSDETGVMYTLSHPEFGDDVERLLEACNRRFVWIWAHDLKADLKHAEEEMRRRINLLHE